MNVTSPFSRRHFLAQSAAATALAVASAGRADPAPASPPAAAPKRSWKKAIMFGMFTGNLSLLDKFKALRDAGFDGVELNAPNTYNKQEVLDACQKTGMLVEGAVDAVHWSLTLGDPDPKKRAAGVEALKGALRECKAWGGTSVLLVPAVVNAQISYADAYARSQEEIRKAIPTAAETGVKIAVENVWNQFLLSPLEAARYVDEFQSPWVGWHFDIGNVINYGWPEQWIHILGKRILKLHIKEYSRKKRDAEGLWKGFNVELMQGDNNWPAIMKALDDVGYAGGWACAEVSGGGAERMKVISEQMDKILAM